jgi:hypothetical protein
MERIAEASPLSRARLIGVVYLLYFVTAMDGTPLVLRDPDAGKDPQAILRGWLDQGNEADFLK